MKNIINILVFASLSVVASLSTAAECNRQPRTVYDNGKTIEIFVSKDQNTEVSFPEESLKGLRPEKGEGLSLHQIKRNTNLRNTISFSLTQDEYESMVPVYGESGTAYMLRLVSKPACADSHVTIKDSSVEALQAQTKTSTGRQKTLIEYLIKHADDKTAPPGYTYKRFKGPLENRKVFKEGSIEMYLESQLVGSHLVGTTLRVINRGRTAYRVNIESIDFSDPSLREVFGIIDELTMEPFNFRLGPYPEFISEVYQNTHMGFIFIVSQKQ